MTIPALREALERRFRLRSPQTPEAAADAAMSVAAPLLKARDKEIALLREEVASLREWVLAAACRPDGLAALAEAPPLWASGDGEAAGDAEAAVLPAAVPGASEGEASTTHVAPPRPASTITQA